MPQWQVKQWLCSDKLTAQYHEHNEGMSLHSVNGSSHLVTQFAIVILTSLLTVVKTSLVYFIAMQFPRPRLVAHDFSNIDQTNDRRKQYLISCSQWNAVHV